jgi:hypothetical protein
MLRAAVGLCQVLFLAFLQSMHQTLPPYLKANSKNGMFSFAYTLEEALPSSVLEFTLQ